jgi:hypothetical protein
MGCHQVIRISLIFDIQCDIQTKIKFDAHIGERSRDDTSTFVSPIPRVALTALSTPAEKTRLIYHTICHTI